MTYAGLVANLDNFVKDKRIFLIYGGNLAVRLDSLHVFRYRIAKTVEKSAQNVTKIAFFVQKGQDLSRFLYDMPYDLKVFYWEEGLLEGEELEDFLWQLGRDQSRVAVVCETDELLKVFKELYPKNSRGLWVDCGQEPNSIESVIVKRVELGMPGAKREVARDALVYLKQLPYLSLFNIFNLLDKLQLDSIRMENLRHFGLLKGDIETFLIRKLLIQGKNSLLKFDLKQVDGGKFFGLLRWYLIMLLRVKTMVKATATVCASKLEIDKFRYDDLKDIGEAYELHDLYKKLYLLLSLMKWKWEYGSLLLLLMYW